MTLPDKLKRALGRPGQRGLALWTLLVTAASLLEVLSMAAVSAFMGWVEAPTEELERLARLSGLQERRDILVGLGLGVLALVSFAKGLNAFTVWSQHRFVWRQDKEMATRLLVSFLSRPYSWFLSQNGAHLNRYLGSREFSANLLAGVTDLVAASVVTVLILATLLLVDLRVALVTMAGVGLAQAGLALTTRSSIRRWSDEAHQLFNRRAVVGQEAMTGIKPLLSFAREASYVDEFVRLSDRGSKLQAWREMVWDIPRFFLEAVALALMLGLTLYFVIEGGSERLLPMLSLYAMAGYRVIPAIHLVFHSLTRIRSNLPALDAYLAFVEASPKLDLSRPTRRLPMHSCLRVEQLEFRYPDQEDCALRQVDFELRPQEMIGIVGSTGAGKSTLVDILMGLLTPTAGRLSVDGKPLDAESLRFWRCSVGYVPQTVFLSDDTVRRNIAFAIPEKEIDDEAVRRAAVAARIDEFIEGLPQGYETRVGENGVRLSGGQRQRLGIARALYGDPDLLILDEATSSLDSATEEAVMLAVGALSANKAIVLVTHRLQMLRNCHRIYVVEHGSVCATGSYQQLLNGSKEFQNLARS